MTSAPVRETDVVEAIRALAEGNGTHAHIVLGIGDDAALWQPSRSHLSAITTDMLVEGVHFTREAMDLGDAGWRAMASNLSDLAAMGARPSLATVALGIPAGTLAEDIGAFYRGLVAAAATEKAPIVGGDLSRAPVWTVAIAAVGEIRPSNVKTRAGGRPGDVIAVTGALGSARAGLELTRKPDLLSGDLAQEALRAFRRPQARCREGRFLAASRNVHAMMDCSDGLSTDLQRLCTASRCGASVATVPVSAPARAAAAALGEDPERFALMGGEDFELLVAVRARAFEHLASRFRMRFRRDLHAVGALREPAGTSWRGAELTAYGWDHFAP